MRRQGRPPQGRIRPGCGKKLARAAAWALRPEKERKYQDWIDELAEDDPSNAWLQGLRSVRDFKDEPWHDTYWQAWHSLRYDRPYVGMGGMEYPISFLAVDAYARRYDIVGEAFDRLLRFLSEIDGAYLAGQRKAAEKPQENQPEVNKSG